MPKSYLFLLLLLPLLQGTPLYYLNNTLSPSGSTTTPLLLVSSSTYIFSPSTVTGTLFYAIENMTHTIIALRGLEVNDGVRVYLPSGNYEVYVTTESGGSYGIGVWEYTGVNRVTGEVDVVVSGFIDVPTEERVVDVDVGVAGMYFVRLNVGRGFHTFWRCGNETVDDFVWDQRFNEDVGLVYLDVGEYIVTIDLGFRVGEYEFIIYSVPEPKFFEFSLDEVVVNATTVASEIHYWDFEILNEKENFVRVYNALSFYIFWKCENSTGGQLWNQRFDRDITSVYFPVGQYRITIGGSNHRSFGDYSFSIIDIPSPSFFTFEVDQIASNATTRPNERHFWYFNVSESRDYYISVDDALSFYVFWRCEDNAGNLIWNERFDRDVTTIFLEEGSYVISIGTDTSQFGTYSFRVITIPFPTTFTPEFSAFVEGYSGGITTPGEFNFLVVDVPSDNYFIRVQDELSFYIYWTMVGNTNEQVIFNERFDRDLGTIAIEADTYTITYGNSNARNTGEYLFYFISVPPTTTEGIEFDSSVTGNVIEGQFKNYTFTAYAGQRAYIAVLSELSFYRFLNLEYQGELIYRERFSSDLGLRSFPYDGLYTWYISEDNRYKGDYEFEMISVPDEDDYRVLGSEDFGSTISGSIEHWGTYSIFEFKASKGQMINLTVTAGTQFYLPLRIYDTTCVRNEILFTRLRDVDVKRTAVLERGGTYIIQVGDRNQRLTDEFEFVLETTNDATLRYIPDEICEVQNYCDVNDCFGNTATISGLISLNEPVLYRIPGLQVSDGGTFSISNGAQVVVDSNVTSSSSITMTNGTMSILGNLNLQTGSKLSLNSDSTLLDIAGCADFTGELSITSNLEEDFSILSYTCHSGEFETVTINDCQAEADYTDTNLILIFSTTTCSTSHPLLPLFPLLLLLIN